MVPELGLGESGFRRLASGVRVFGWCDCDAGFALLSRVSNFPVAFNLRLQRTVMLGSHSSLSLVQFESARVRACIILSS